MYCNKCGSMLREDATFCPKCGTPCTADQSTAAAPKSPAPPAAPARAKSSVKTIVSVISLIAVFAVVLGLSIKYKDADHTTTEPAGEESTVSESVSGEESTVDVTDVSAEFELDLSTEAQTPSGKPEYSLPTLTDTSESGYTFGETNTFSQPTFPHL